MRGRASRLTARRLLLLAALVSVVADFSLPLHAQDGGPKPATSLTSFWQRLLLPTNSHAAASRGARQYENKKFDEASKSFDIADHLQPDAKSAFNLGTAQIAAGKTTEGAATLGRALRNAVLRPDALYNRGNSALASKAYEYAIRDYTETLKLRPADVNAKRNLEIALKRLDEMQQSASGGGNKPQPQQQPQSGNQQQKSPAGQQAQQQQPQQADAEALLRSVQQQEQEELERMKRARAANVRVGW